MSIEFRVKKSESSWGAGLRLEIWTLPTINKARCTRVPGRHDSDTRYMNPKIFSEVLYNKKK